MARISKTPPFEIWTDTTLDDVIKEQDEILGRYGLEYHDGFVTDSEDEGKTEDESGMEDTDADDEHGGTGTPGYARTSISSLPESTNPTDYEHLTPMHRPYTPGYERPSVSRPDSFRRSNMGSPSLQRGSRGSILRGSRSRTGTPKAEGFESPRSRYRRPTDDITSKQYPLVLLHATLLPVSLAWSFASMRDILPPHTMKSVQLLRLRASDTVLQRGVLIPHPQEDYDLLVERLLDALELQAGRVTKCGHFRARLSTDSGISSVGEDSDSALGSSVDGSDEAVCSTCREPVDTLVNGLGRQKWSVKVFASNGLMRANTWAAAWNEMESIDVEIMPLISDQLREKLEVMRAEEAAEAALQSVEEEDRIREIVEEQVLLAHESAKREYAAVELRARSSALSPVLQSSGSPVEVASSGVSTSLPHQGNTMDNHDSPGRRSSLPPIYRPKDVPVSVLLRNYLYLLAQDRRVLTVCFGTLIAFLLALRLATLPAEGIVDATMSVTLRNVPDNGTHDKIFDHIDPASSNGHWPVVESSNDMLPATTYVDEGLSTSASSLGDISSGSKIESGPAAMVRADQSPAFHLSRLLQESCWAGRG